MERFVKKICFVLSVFLIGSPSFLHSEENIEELLFSDIPIALSTKHLLKIDDAPSIASVVTGQEIRNMGARGISDVLRGSGFGVSKSPFGFADVLEIRGIGGRSGRIKFLIDGHSVNTVFGQNLDYGYDDFSVDHAKQIEIIRGPGSALYGSSAFTGAVNVVTKDGAEVDGIKFSGGGGKFNTSLFSVQAGKKFNELDAALFIKYHDSDGPKLTIEKDVFGTSGLTNAFDKGMEGTLKLKYKDISFNSMFITREKGGYLGASHAVNDESELDHLAVFDVLAYEYSLNEAMNVMAKLYSNFADSDPYFELFSEGVIPGYPDGFIGNPKLKEKILGTEVQLDYLWLANHLTTFGIMREQKSVFDATSITNFNPLTGAPLGSLQDITSWGNFIKEDPSRDIWAVYVQDVWDMTGNATVTLGVRHDHYSDFGETTNPRAALVYKFKEDWDMKILYGTAFRAPSFGELYLINNPALLGNEDLDPETVQTIDLSVGHRFHDNSRARLTYFNTRFKNQIQEVPIGMGILQYENYSGADIHGVEAEFKRTCRQDTYVYGNYTFQEAKDRGTGNKLPDVAKYKGNLGFNGRVTPYFNGNVNVFFSGNRSRAAGDARKALPAFALVDVTLIAKKFYKGVELRLSGHNILGKEYFDPEPVNGASTDLPREGVSYLLEVSISFNGVSP